MKFNIQQREFNHQVKSYFSSIFYFLQKQRSIISSERQFLQKNLSPPTIHLTMPRNSSNFQVTQLVNSSMITQSQPNFNDFGSFIYKDHVTMKQYDVNDLRRVGSHVFVRQLKPLLKKHHHNKSVQSLAKTKSRFQNINDEETQLKRKSELSHFLQELMMMKKIKNNRNHIVSGMQKAEMRKTILPSIANEITTEKAQKSQNINSLKQKIRQQVSSLNSELFREYVEKQKPYRPVFNELTIASSKGAMDSKKIKQIKKKLKQCIKIKNDQNPHSFIKKVQLNPKQIQQYDNYFNSVTNEIDEEIRLKMRHEASFNWKYGKRQSTDQMYKVDQITESSLLKLINKNN